MKKFYAIALALALLLPLAAAAFASVEYMPYADDIIRAAKTDVSVSAGGKITATATITAKMSASSIGFPTFCIQEKQGGTWVTVVSGAGMASDASSRKKTITYTKVTGRSYQVKTTYKAVCDGVTYTAPAYTKSV